MALAVIWNPVVCIMFQSHSGISSTTIHNSIICSKRFDCRLSCRLKMKWMKLQVENEWSCRLNHLPYYSVSCKQLSGILMKILYYLQDLFQMAVACLVRNCWPPNSHQIFSEDEQWSLFSLLKQPVIINYDFHTTVVPDLVLDRLGICPGQQIFVLRPWSQSIFTIHCGSLLLLIITLALNMEFIYVNAGNVYSTTVNGFMNLDSLHWVCRLYVAASCK